MGVTRHRSKLGVFSVAVQAIDFSITQDERVKDFFLSFLKLPGPSTSSPDLSTTKYAPLLLLSYTLLLILWISVRECVVCVCFALTVR